MRRLVLAALLAAAAPAAARAESPRWGSFELMFGQYHPDVDAEFKNGAHPWQDIFGKGEGWLFRAGFSKSLFTGFGSLDVGLQSGYFQRSGKGIGLITGTASGDTTTFKMSPTAATLTYRLDYFADRFNVPLAPYGRVAFERYNWWITNGSGSTSMRGATNGWSAAAGLALLLDFFDPSLARELDNDSGINHTYAFGELRKTKVNDFGSSKSWDLSDDGISWSAGLLFVF